MTSLCNSLDTAASVGSEIDDFEKKELAEIMEKVGTAINALKDHIPPLEFQTLYAVTSSLTDEISRVCKIVEGLENRVKSLQKQVDDLKLQVEYSTKNSNLLVLRQLTSSYQYRAALYCNVRKVGKMSFVDYDSLEKASNRDPTKSAKFATLKSTIANYFDDELDLKTTVDSLKSLGLHVAYPVIGADMKPEVSDTTQVEAIINMCKTESVITCDAAKDCISLLKLIKDVTDLLKTDSIVVPDNLLYANWVDRIIPNSPSRLIRSFNLLVINGITHCSLVLVVFL